MNKSLLYIVPMACLLLLVGCATPARVSEMTFLPSPSVLTKPGSKYHQSISVAEVKGGEETHPLWMSKVSSDDFKAALEASLENANYHAPEPARYLLSAELLNLRQPWAGFNMTVTALVNYVLKDKETGAIVLNHTAKSPYKARFSEAFLGMTRLKIANEGAIRTNIESLIEELAKQGTDKT
jgi:hypothetical protein